MRIERHVAFWTVALLALLGLVALLRDVLLPFVAGTVIAYFLNPVADRLQRLGLPRAAAAALIVAAASVAVVAAAVLLMPLLASQVRQLVEGLPSDLARHKAALDAWLAGTLGHRIPGIVQSFDLAIAELGQSLKSSVGTIARVLWSQGLAIVNFLSLMLITPVVVFYLLVDWHRMLARIDGWLPRDHAGTIRRLAAKVNEAVSAFIRGQGTICLILGAFYATCLTLVGLPYGVLIGLATGLLAFVPFVGWAAGLLVSVGIALAEGWPSTMLAVKVAAVLAAGMAIDSAVLSPKIVGEKVGLHPVWLMFALFVFSYLFGFVGMLVAVPVAAAVGVLVRFGLDVYMASEFYAGSGGDAGGAAPAAPPPGSPPARREMGTGPAT